MKERDKAETIFLKNLGNRIATLRKEKNLTQKELGDKCDMERQNIMRIEAGRTNPTAVTIWKLCKALGKEFAELFPPNTSKDA